MVQRVINGIFIEERGGNQSMLLVEKNSKFIPPGGKPHQGESDIECLLREIEEELPGTRLTLHSFKPYKEFAGISPTQGIPLNVSTYIGAIEKLGSPDGRDVIKKAMWIPYGSTQPLSPTTREIMESLHRDGYL